MKVTARTLTEVRRLAGELAAAAANQIGWDDVQVEDCFTGPNGIIGGTTLGPRWPELSSTVYLGLAPNDLQLW